RPLGIVRTPRSSLHPNEASWVGRRGFSRSPILSEPDIVGLRFCPPSILSGPDRLHSAPSATLVILSGIPTTISQWSAPIASHFVSIASQGAPKAISAAPARRPRPRWHTGTELPAFGTPTPSLHSTTANLLGTSRERKRIRAQPNRWNFPTRLRIPLSVPPLSPRPCLASRAYALPASRPISYRRLCAPFGPKTFKRRIPSPSKNDSGTTTVRPSPSFDPTLADSRWRT